ncbi:MAG: D-gamma-glutamyl-meso-diaminopimelic acid endopeptidase CwlS [Chlamydiae bacterium]|nr:D-gamma-glutamyl-meso-diaminopimelic acid endopeptidase CwlS [Chlamydiota bacterium]
MSRKNTIIAAVLINTVFLVVLFSLAIKTTIEDEKSALPNLATNEEILSEVNHEEFPSLLLEDAKTDSKPLLEEKANFLKQLESLEKQAIPQKTPPEIKRETAMTPKAPVFEDKYVMITVKKGDMLAKIAKANGATVKEIMELNDLKSTMLRIGQKLKVPKHQKIQMGNQDEDFQFYTIQKGDNLWLIASKHKLRVNDLMRLNQLDEAKAKRLKPGDQIRIR